MRPIRALSSLAFSLLLVTLAACGGSSPAATIDGGDGGGEPSTAASVAEPSTDGGDGGSSGGGGGGDAKGAEDIADSLTPPNASETSRTTSGGLVLLTFESPDSLDSLTSFYEGAIRDAGLNVTSTTTADTGTFWTFESGDFDGAVTLVGGGGSNNTTAVSIQVLDKSV